MTGRGLSLRAGIGASAALLVGIGAASPASAQSGLSVDASLSGGVASNPFLQTGDTPLSGSATLEVSPSYLLDMGVTRFAVRGDATLTEYLKRYRNSDSYSLDASGTHQVSERSTLSARLGYVNSVVGAFNDSGIIGSGVIIPGVTSTLPAAPVDPNSAIQPAISPVTLGNVYNVTTDPSLGGIGQRRQSYSAGAGYGTGLGPRDRLNLDLSVVASRSGRGSFDDFNYVTQQIGYRRALKPGVDITADFTLGRADYLGRRSSDSVSYLPTVGGSFRLGESTSLNLGVGVSVVRTNLTAPGATRTSTNLSAQGSLCKQDARTNACLSLSRAAVPSVAQGVRIQSAASLSAGMRVSERGSASVQVSYSRSGEPLGDVTNSTLFVSHTEYVNVRGDYSQRLSQRLSAFVSAGGARVYGDESVSRGANYEVRAGVRVRFGALR